MAVHHVNHADKVLAFRRWDRGGPGDDVVVVVNLADRHAGGYRIGLPRAGRWRVRLNSDWEGYSPDFGDRGGWDTDAEPRPYDGMPSSGVVEVAP